MAAIISIIISYLIGSLNMSILLSRILKTPDPRNQGSGSAGATNVLRTIGKNQAILVLVGDIIKGLIAVWIGRILGVYGVMLGFVAVAAVVGHIFPVYFKFKGGKGVATAIGSIWALAFWIGIMLIIVWVAVVLISRYSSLASLCTIVAAPLFMLIFGKAMFAFPVFIITVLIIWKHTDNIQRLRTGTETKIQF